MYKRQVWYVLCVSLSSKEAVNAGKVAFWPVGFNLFSYQKILGEGEFLGSFLISIKRVVLGTAVSMVCVLMDKIANPEERKWLSLIHIEMCIRDRYLGTGAGNRTTGV